MRFGNSAKCQVSVHASVIESQVWIDSDSIVTSGITKNTTSQTMAGAPRRYGLAERPRRRCRRGGSTPCRSAERAVPLVQVLGVLELVVRLGPRDHLAVGEDRRAVGG